ncbi:hypothetical protein FN846DRAFT_899643 [Sphaerosporella brunnea]|uniref:Sedlin n=1 Tax=Sphaerosporella brunnea TaxID=1250544 RepID=A0A5J5ER92_9PEZI|nr:hypothetical protein FN846DRAFT_899643 [Sphaerosporella brunnea]
MATPHISCIALIGKKARYPTSLNATLDVFSSRLPMKTNGDSDFGMLYAVDDTCALYGWLTNTGVKIVVAVESPVGGGGGGGGGGEVGVFRALQTAYIGLVCNPFFENDETRPITSRRFLAEVRRIAETWRPGAQAAP